MAVIETPFKLRGGCGCHAIRYRISVPALKDRGSLPYDQNYDPKSGEEPKYRFPMTAMDHCNDCRSHTGSLINYWHILPIEWVELSCAEPGTPAHHPSPERGSRIEYETPEAKEKEEKARTWFPAKDIVMSLPAAHFGRSPFPFLGFWKSSSNRLRTFCNRCGTSLSYTAIGGELPANWVPMLDMLLGTLDREDLESYGWNMPKEQLWGDFGFDWAKDMALGKTEMKCRPNWKLADD